MIIDDTQTILIQPNCSANVFSRHVVIDVDNEKPAKEDAEAPSPAAETPKIVDPVLLSVFGHRFMSIAEQVRKNGRNYTHGSELTCPDGPHTPEDVCFCVN